MVCAARKLQALYHKRSTDGSGTRTVGCSLERRSQWRCKDSLGCSTLRRFQSLLSLPFELRVFFESKTTQLSTVNRFEASPPSSRLGTDCFTSNLTQMSNVRARFRILPKNIHLTSHCRAESRAAQVSLATLFAFHGAVQIIARSSPTHCLER